MADAWSDITASISSSALSSALPQLWKRKALVLAKYEAGLYGALTLDPYPEKSGSTVNLTRYPIPAALTSGLTEGENPDATALDSSTFSATLNMYGGYVAPSDFAKKVVVDGLEKVPEIVDTWQKDTIELWTAKNIATKLKQILVDNDSTYQKDVLVTTSASNSTTVVISTSLNQADSFWVGGLMTVDDKTSPLDGQSFYISASDQSDTSITVAAMSEALTAGTKIHLSVPTALTVADKMSFTGLRLAQRHLMRSGRYGANYWNDGGGYDGIFGPDPYNDILIDTNVQNLFTYKEKESGMRQNNPGGKLAMINFIITSTPFKCAVTGAGTYAATGAVEAVPIIGKNCALKMPLGPDNFSLLVKNKAQVGGPLEMFETVGFKRYWAARVIDACAGVAVMCGSQV